MTSVVVPMAIVVDGFKPMSTTDHRAPFEGFAVDGREPTDDFYVIARIRSQNYQGCSVNVNA